MVTRRGFFASLLAPFVAKFLPKPRVEPLGVSIRYIRAYDVSTEQFVNRIDILYGAWHPNWQIFTDSSRRIDFLDDGDDEVNQPMPIPRVLWGA